MTGKQLALPRIATHEEWDDARRKLLAKEKELTRMQDALTALTSPQRGAASCLIPTSGFLT